MPNNPTSEEQIFITAKEAAQILHVSMPTMYELTHRKDFPAAKLGKKILIHVEGLRRWSKEQVGMHV